jgi:predicted O-methyltransferase YrrM
MRTQVEFMPVGGTRPLDVNGRVSEHLRSPVFAFLGLRPVMAQHTREEDELLRQAAAGRRCIVEIGVAEGASAAALRSTMALDGTLHLIDPFHLSRWKPINGMKRTARRAVGTAPRGRVVWIEKFSDDAIGGWNAPIDLLFVDGDHQEEAVARDWKNWSQFVVPGGLVVLHDARVFEGGWTTRDWGSVRLVNQLFRNGGTPGWRIVRETHSMVVVERVP